MNIKKIEKQLKKINQLFDNIKEDGTVSAIERDLMLSYIRGLYEKIVMTENNSSTDSSSPHEKKIDPVIEIPKVEEVKSPVKNVADVVMKEVVEADQRAAQHTSSSQSQVEVNNEVASQPESAISEVVEESNPEAPQEILDLFEFESVSELSDKLSRSPISDLSNAMGINEKYFTVQELFGGDSALFTKSMEALDKLTSLEQARDYLVEHVAVDQKWSEKGKLKKAIHFIKLISRRY